MSRSPAAALRAPAAALRVVLAERDLAVLSSSWAAVSVAGTTATITLTVASYAAGGTAGVATTLVLRTVPTALGGPLLGRWLERAEPRRVMATVATTAAAAVAACALRPGSLAVLVVLGLLMSLSQKAFRVAQQTALPGLSSSAAQLTAANVLVSVVDSLGLVLGPALAGVVLGHGGVRGAFLLSAALFLVGALRQASLGSARTEPRAAAPQDRQVTARSPLRDPAARVVLAVQLVQAVAAGGLRVLYASMAVTLLATGSQGVGLLTAAFGVGALVTSLGLFALAGSPRLGAAAVGGLLLLGGPLLVAAGVQLVPVVVTMVCLAGAGNVVVDVTSVTLLQRAVPAQRLAAAFGSRQTVTVLGGTGGALVAVWLDDRAGTALALCALAAPAVVGAVAALGPLQRLDRTLAAPTALVALLRGLPGFALLPGPQLEAAALRLQRVELAAQARVVVQGDPGTDYWIVERGQLRVAVDGRDVGDLGPGEAFGEIALLRDLPRTATVTATTPVVLQRLARADFLAAVGSPGALASYDGVVEQRLRRAAPATPTRVPEQ